MATRGLIAIENKDGSIEAIYNHNDSYPEYLMDVLNKHYISERKVRQAIALGDASIIAPMLETNEPHSFNEPCPGVSIFYARDYGAKATLSLRFESFDELIRKHNRFYIVDYIYVFKDGEWLGYNVRSKEFIRSKNV